MNLKSNLFNNNFYNNYIYVIMILNKIISEKKTNKHENLVV
jgi:hypothetical protein